MKYAAIIKYMSTIKEIWHSSYEYGKGTNDEPQTGEHYIEFIRQGESWTGTSLPNEEDSELSLNLTQHNDELRGEWQEKTSPTGSYGGRKFGAWILKRIQNDK